MDSFSQEFKDWMDQRGLSPDDVSEGLKKEAGTIKQWRSRGIPKRESVRSHVREFMTSYAAEQAEALRNSGALTLEVDMETFNSWNRAALDAGQIMEDWAIEGLDALARQTLPPSILRAAEDPAAYLGKELQTAEDIAEEAADLIDEKARATNPAE